jgi:hypothetical protein
MHVPLLLLLLAPTRCPPAQALSIHIPPCLPRVCLPPLLLLLLLLAPRRPHAGSPAHALSIHILSCLDRRLDGQGGCVLPGPALNWVPQPGPVGPAGAVNATVEALLQQATLHTPTKVKPSQMCPTRSGWCDSSCRAHHYRLQGMWRPGRPAGHWRELTQHMCTMRNRACGQCAVNQRQGLHNQSSSRWSVSCRLLSG